MFALVTPLPLFFEISIFASPVHTPPTTSDHVDFCRALSRRGKPSTNRTQMGGERLSLVGFERIPKCQPDPRNEQIGNEGDRKCDIAPHRIVWIIHLVMKVAVTSSERRRWFCLYERGTEYTAELFPTSANVVQGRHITTIIILDTILRVSHQIYGIIKVERVFANPVRRHGQRLRLKAARHVKTSNQSLSHVDLKYFIIYRYSLIDQPQILPISTQPVHRAIFHHTTNPAAPHPLRGELVASTLIGVITSLWAVGQGHCNHEFVTFGQCVMQNIFSCCAVEEPKGVEKMAE
ncbi:hypothetical protein DE146DRAFT_737471 [Phaeosphaeria sp. MPI-PUGE-AT-0046c]|nr:hypothetical protein DE146DRAFT_737471 [Phaeosphaeria sp. MPI-PUGE-AT-0046c]